MDGSFIRRMRISCRGISPVPQGTDIIVKGLAEASPYSGGCGGSRAGRARYSRPADPAADTGPLAVRLPFCAHVQGRGTTMCPGPVHVEQSVKTPTLIPSLTKPEPSEAGPVLRGGATKRYKVFGASQQTDAGNVVSTVCSDDGGGGGSRTPVRKRFSRNLSVRRRLLRPCGHFPSRRASRHARPVR